ncbi:MAG: four helix bundle protein [Anaerolineales bacterium]|nr:four helix bundle protein [Anaerolineales bacterium]
MSIQGLQRLEVWRKAKDFALKVHREVLPLLPPEEKWALNQQIRRSAQSIPANIAEGYGRYYYQDNVRFCYIARGSLEETLSHIVLAHELDYLPDALYQELGQNGEDLTRLINGYIAYLKRSKQGVNEPGAHHAVREPFEPYIEDTPGDKH